MDIDDRGKILPLDDMMRAAKARGPMSSKDEATAERLVEQVFAELEAAIADMAEQSGEQRQKRIVDWLRDEGRVRWLGIGAGRKPARWAALLLAMEGQNKTAARALRGAVESVAKALQTTGTQATRYAPMTKAGLLCPPGYVIDATGVYVDGGDQVTTRPLYMIARGHDVSRPAQRFVRLRWADGDRTEEATIDRATAMDSRGLQRVAAAAGAPITSANALNVTRFLDAFETQNIGVMPVIAVTTRLGWQPNGSFMLGATCFGPETVSLVDEHRAANWRTEGTWEEWRRAFDLFSGLPLMVSAVLASLSAPLLTVLNAPGFVVDWAGETSHGKTTALRAAASLWGAPDPEAPNGPLGTWKSSSIAGIMASAAFCHSLPFILDDTKEAAAKPELIAQTLYALPSGRDSTRADERGGAREPRTWRTVMLSSGEAPIISFTQAGGARARTLSLQGEPMGPKNSTNAGRATLVKELLIANYGHLGPRAIAELMSRPEHFKARYATHRAIRRAGKAGVDDRIAESLAVLDTALDLGIAAGMPTPQCAPVDFIARNVANARAADPPLNALRDLVGWLASIPQRLEGRASPGRDPSSEYVGTWAPGDAWNEIALQPYLVKEQLERFGYDSAAVLESWISRGWRKMENDRGDNPKRPFNGCRARMLVIKREAYDLACGDLVD